MRTYKRRVDLTGERQGKLVALRPSPGGAWIVRCDCGKVYRVSMSSWRGYGRGGGIRSCRDCMDRYATADKISVRVEGGQTVAQLARMTGLRLNTVYVRLLRGWSRHELVLAVHRPGERRA